MMKETTRNPMQTPMSSPVLFWFPSGGGDELQAIFIVFSLETSLDGSYRVRHVLYVLT